MELYNSKKAKNTIVYLCAVPKISSIAKFPSENPAQVLRINREGVLIYHNSAALTLIRKWGCQLNENIPAPWMELVAMALEDRKKIEREVKCDENICCLTIVPIPDENYVNLYGHDITEQRRAEKEILRFNRELEQIVENRTKKLIKAHKLLLDEIEERKKLEIEIIKVSEREKRSIAQELHDSIGQQFAGIAFMAKVLEQQLIKEGSDKAKKASVVAHYSNRAIDQLRSLARGLNPLRIDEDIEYVLKELALTVNDLFEVNCEVKCEGDIKVSNIDAAVNIYRIAQEAVTNAVKHGKAKSVQIGLVKGKNKSILTIKNDGKPFCSRGTEHNGLGMHIMRHRAEMLNGTIDVRTVGSAGTVVTCIFDNSKVLI